MLKILIVSVVLLSSALWLNAQTANMQSNGGASNQASVEGCLKSSNGNYTLVADSGTIYQLRGDTSQLSEHIGHEVRIMGTMPASAATSTPSAETPGASQETMLNVKSVKHISTTCKAMAK